MPAKQGRRLKKKKKKKYYKPPDPLDKFRHRLADGTPTYELLHYFHGRDKLPKDIKAVAEAAEKLHQVRDILSEVHDQGGIDEVLRVIDCDMGDLKAVISGTNSVGEMIKRFMLDARKALIMKTMKDPQEE